MVGISGGVDSAVAALLLKQQGHEVIGAFMKNWEDEDEQGYCQADQDYQDSLAVCEKIGIPLLKTNFAQEYRKNVFADFLREYQRGRTPNPDVLCNREIKFKSFLQFAERNGADFLATGHYAGLKVDKGRVQLTQARDQNKDQTYFLYALDQQQLSKALFPLGGLVKQKVRQLASDFDLPVADKKDSTGICFIGERPFADFIGQYLPDQPGNMVDEQSKVIGTHNGLMYYTLGQRQGLGIGGSRQASGEPWYVAGKDISSNQLLVVQGHDHPLMMASELEAKSLNWIDGQAPAESFHCLIKSRYRQQAQPGLVRVTRDGCQVVFDQPQRSLTPGQSVVFYQDEYCLGGGIIEAVEGQWPRQ